MKYNWQQADWPEFKYDIARVEDILFSFADRVGLISGLLKGLPEDARTETMIDMIVSEAIKTPEIKGEYLRICHSPIICLSIISDISVCPFC